MDASHAIPPRGAVTAAGAAFPQPADLRLVDADLPKAQDMSHHLNTLARNRQPNSLKELYKWVNSSAG
jgi:hypothetical protein